MFAYVVTASFPSWGPDKYRMLVFSVGDKVVARSLAEQSGWLVKKISLASADDIQDLGDYRKLAEWAKGECRKREDEKARQANSARLAEQELLRRKQIEAERREEEREQRREVALAIAIGDIVDCEPEPEVRGNAILAAICSKVSVFFNQAAVNKTDVYSSISMDYAQFQVAQGRLLKTCRILQQIIDELNGFLAIDQSISDSLHRVELERQSAEGRINAIGSRTHVFGGSGEGLLISWLCAEGAASNDRKEIGAVNDRYLQLQRDFSLAYHSAKARQRLQEFRAKTAVSILLAATGLGSAISLDIPEDVETLAKYVN